MIFTPTGRRVQAHSPAEVNERIRRETEANVARCARLGVEAIDRRLQELDREWDMERVLQTNAASVSLAGIFLSATVSRKFLALPGLVAGFLLQHALQGWCPPVSLLRRLGFRTAREIEEERYALKILRGDFKDLQTVTSGAPDVEGTFRALRRIES